MKLIRTLIENKLGDNNTRTPTRAAPRTPAPSMPRLHQSKPVSEALQAHRVPSDGLEHRLRAFKTDLVELAPRQKPHATGQDRRRIWDLDAGQPEEKTTPEEAAISEKDASGDVPKPLSTADAQDHVALEERSTTPPEKNRERIASAPRMFEVPPPIQPQRPLTAGRTKTRIVGFCGDDGSIDPFDVLGDEPTLSLEFPVGWLVITKGPGLGTSFVLQNPVSSIGRGIEQTITLNFGDDTISRQNHAAVAYDDQTNACFLGFGGKANLVRLNNRPVLSTEQLSHGDVIRVGQTDLRYIALCGPDFSWRDDETGHADE